MIFTSGTLICLIAFTNQLVHRRLISINSTSNDTSKECCTKEGCMCASLSVALQNIARPLQLNLMFLTPDRPTKY